MRESAQFIAKKSQRRYVSFWQWVSAKPRLFRRQLNKHRLDTGSLVFYKSHTVFDPFHSALFKHCNCITFNVLALLGAYLRMSLCRAKLIFTPAYINCIVKVFLEVDALIFFLYFTLCFPLIFAASSKRKWKVHIRKVSRGIFWNYGGIYKLLLLRNENLNFHFYFWIYVFLK